MGCSASTMRVADIPEMQEDEETGEKPETAGAVSLNELMGALKTASHEITVVFNTQPISVPYETSGNACDNVPVNWGDHTHTALYIGIANFAKVGNENFLVSDSFGPCVPVVVFHEQGTWLGHANGSAGIPSKIKETIPASERAQVVVIRKTLHAKQNKVATVIKESLEEMGFPTRLVDVETSASIAVIVGALSKRILVYSPPV